MVLKIGGYHRRVQTCAGRTTQGPSKGVRGREGRFGKEMVDANRRKVR